MPLIRTATRLARLPTLLRAPLCRRCTSGAPSEYLQGPSEKQLAYAEALAEKFGADVPEDVRTSKIACSEFIDQQKQREPPSDKQLAFVKELAQQAQIDPPDHACVSSAGASHHALHTRCTTPRPRHAHPSSCFPHSEARVLLAYCSRAAGHQLQAPAHSSTRCSPGAAASRRTTPEFVGWTRTVPRTRLRASSCCLLPAWYVVSTWVKQLLQSAPTHQACLTHCA